MRVIVSYDQKGRISLKTNSFQSFPRYRGGVAIGEKGKKSKEKSTVKIHLSVVVSKHSRKKDAEDLGTRCLCRDSMGLRHSFFNLPPSGQAFMCV